MTASYVQIGAQLVSESLLGDVVVLQRLNAHWTCSVSFRTTEDAPPDVESMQGQPVRIATYDALGVEHLLFSGIVHAVSRQSEVWGSYGGTIHAVSLTWKMDAGRRHAYYLKQDPQAIATGLAGSSGLALGGTVEGSSLLSRVQWAETDFRFLLQLADDAESWVRPTEAGVEVQSSFQPGASLSWREGDGALFHFEVTGNVRPGRMSGTHYDADAMQSASYAAIASEATFSTSVPDFVAASVAAGQAIAAAEHGQRHRALTLDDFNLRLQLESRRAAVNSVLCRGRSREPKVIAGEAITIAGTPDADGTYGVLACEHRWTRQGYENSFVATPAKRWFAPARIRRPSVRGLYPARVVDNHDPHNQGRLRVQFAWLTSNATTWVRLLAPHAGPDRGMLFLPEIGDEVSIGFEGGDPERPVIVGSVWNGAQQPPTEGFWQPNTVNQDEFADNNIKRIVTKSGLRITLNDTPGQESIHLATPSSNEVLFTEKANETGRAMVAFHTTGDIYIQSPKGRTHLRAAKHSKHVGTPQALAGMTCKQKMEAAIAHAPLGRGVLNALGGAKGIAAGLAIMFVVGVAANFTPAGWAADAVAVLIAAGMAVIDYLALKQLLRGLEQLYDFYKLCCKEAKTKADLERAGKLFADAVGNIGVATLTLLLSRMGKGKGSVEEPLGPERPRLPQDENVNPKAPKRLPTTRKIGPNVNQNIELQNDVSAASADGATDIRVNQQQVDAAGNRVGINRPDLQYTDVNGQRVYSEYDTDPANGLAHQERILSNDPSGVVILKTIK